MFPELEHRDLEGSQQRTAFLPTVVALEGGNNNPSHDPGSCVGSCDLTGACGGGDGNADTAERQRANLTESCYRQADSADAHEPKSRKGKVEVSFQERARLLLKI